MPDLQRNQIVGFEASNHGRPGWFIWADGTRSGCPSLETEDLLTVIKLAHETGESPIRDFRYVWAGFKRELFAAISRKLIRTTRKLKNA